jgi:hypothetical protein
MIAGLLAGLLLSAASALLLPWIFPTAKKASVSHDLHQAKEAARLLTKRLERVSEAVAEGPATSL